MTTLTPSSECPHGSDPALCPPCNRPIPWAPPTDIGPALTAAYRSRCNACSEHIEPGELICASDFGYIHEECAS